MNNESFPSKVGFIVVLIISIGFAIFILVYVSAESKKNSKVDIDGNEISIRYEDFSDKLVVDKSTHIVYIQYFWSGKQSLSPYYSANGRLCRYEDDKFVEIMNEENE